MVDYMFVEKLTEGQYSLSLPRNIFLRLPRNISSYTGELEVIVDRDWAKKISKRQGKKLLRELEKGRIPIRLYAKIIKDMIYVGGISGA